MSQDKLFTREKPIMDEEYINFGNYVVYNNFLSNTKNKDKDKDEDIHNNDKKKGNYSLLSYKNIHLNKNNKSFNIHDISKINEKKKLI